MNTIEMYTNAQNNGYTYRCDKYKMLYSKAVGLVEDDDYNETIYLEDFVSAITLDELMSFDWVEVNNIMTAEEAEKKYGIKILKTNI